VLNDKSEEFFKNVSAVLLRSGRTPAAATGRFGRKVQYQITLPEKWESFVYTGPSIHDAIELDYKARFKDAKASGGTTDGSSTKEVSQAKSSYLSVQPGQTIPDVLELMFKQVPEVQQLANSDKLKQTDQYVTFYKYLVSISSDEDSFTVHVDVIPFEVPNVVPPKADSDNSVSQYQSRFFNEIDGRRYPKNYFEFDYIFTGKNLDILGMDLKLQDLQMLLAANVKVGEGELFNVSSKGQGDKTDAEKSKTPLPEILGSTRAYDPIMIPLLTKEQVNNFSNYVGARTVEGGRQRVVDQQSYTRNLSAFYAQSPIMTNITIKGNPAIMAKFNLESPVQHTTPISAGATGISTTNLDVKKQYRADLEKRILRQSGIQPGVKQGTFSVERPLGDAAYVTQPVFALINIMGPNVDPLTNELINGEDFATRVLYDNYYVVFKVTNNIDRGVFTQQIELWSHNVYGTGKLSAEDVNKRKAAQAPSSIGGAL
jgi:hypothetical protein